ncbi:MAG: glutamate racemase [Ktedonobacteraceae bacterium]|nr:glutamate racemase [Ktedonobacteraceae bacterium]
MEYSSLEQEAASHIVHPARDAERSTENIHESGTANNAHLAYAPIGIFDSGVGGLTILSALRQVLPQEDYIYFGDTAHLPYGVRSEEEITGFALQISRFLIEQGVKLIVVACNTASQAALNTLRASYTIPFVGVVPAVKPAARMTRRGRIGVAATNQAARAAYLRRLIDDFAEGIDVYAVGCPELVTLVEHGELEGTAVEETLRQAFEPLLSKGVDVIVLGCTHFPALRPAIERVAGKQVQVIDSGAAIARRVHSLLEAENSLHPEQESRMGAIQLWCSGEPRSFSKVASRLLGYPVAAQHITLPQT